MKFSHCGRLLATAGQDNVVRIWVLKTAFDYFNNMRLKYNTEGKRISNIFDFFFICMIIDYLGKKKKNSAACHFALKEPFFFFLSRLESL